MVNKKIGVNQEYEDLGEQKRSCQHEVVAIWILWFKSIFIGLKDASFKI